MISKIFVHQHRGTEPGRSIVSAIEASTVLWEPSVGRAEGRAAWIRAFVVWRDQEGVYDLAVLWTCEEESNVACVRSLSKHLSIRYEEAMDLLEIEEALRPSILRLLTEEA